MLGGPRGPRASALDLAHALNPAQRGAVESDAPRILILAGAGSGKTRTLTYRVARLIEAGVPPEAVVLVTFTHRAAREMTGRIEALLGSTARRVRAGTFHALAAASLRARGRQIGFPNGFGIIGRDDQAQVMAAAIGEAKIDPGRRRFPSPESLIALLSLAINAAETVETTLIRRQPHLLAILPEMDAAFAAYTRKKLEMGVMDFDDLLLHWHAALGPGPLGELLRGEVAHVLVDEYQDTNLLQAEIAERLAGRGHLCVVGDDAQSIYAFRGARAENILEFPQLAPTEVHQLTVNYRSEPGILAVANASIAENPRQFPKVLTAVRAATGLPARVPAKDAAQQAEFVAQRVLELRDEGVPLAAQAVLYRAHGHALELEVELTRREVPYRVRSGVRLLERAHVKDLLAFLRVVANPLDELAWQRILAMQPGVGGKIGGAVLAAVKRAAIAGDDPFAQLGAPELLAATRGRGRLALPRLGEALQALAGLAAAPARMIHLLLERPEPASPGPGHLLDHLTARYGEPEARVRELAQLAEVAAQQGDLEAFLADVTLAGELAGERGASEAPEERLTLTTVHQAKGLEWRAVFVIGLTDGAFPLTPRDDEADAEAEERRLFYVAVTRAEEQLYLTHPVSRPAGLDERLLLRPSRFLEELPPELLERWSLESG